MKNIHLGGIAILDFGSQYTQLIARRIREQNVFSEILPHDINASELLKRNPKGIILSGGPSSVYTQEAPKINPDILDINLPILGICYGLHLLTEFHNGQVSTSEHGEYGAEEINIKNNGGIFHNVNNYSQVWMSHQDKVLKVPDEWTVIAESSTGIVAAMTNKERTRYAVQFHPEVSHTLEGKRILQNFILNIAGCEASWTPGTFIQDQVELIRQRVGSKKVLIGVSGGVDSSVASALLNLAIGDQAVSVLIDHGLLRKNEAKECIDALKTGLGVNIHLADESKIFLKKLSGITDPEGKRKIIGEQFIRSFEKISASFGEMEYLCQGTLYPDVIESGSSKQSHVIKSHHNVGGLPEDMEFELIEPLRELFKDEVRKVGLEMGLPSQLLNRHPFPGPGLAVRILGDITEERLNILREADQIYIDILQDEELYNEIWQAFCVLIPVKTVGVMGDQRTYDNLIGLRAVTSVDGMTADWYAFPPKVLSRISNSIVNKVSGVNRVVYDVTSKPPGTIEWE